MPTAADDVVATATSGSITVNVASVCRSIDLTGYPITSMFTVSANLSVGDAGGGSFIVPANLVFVRTGGNLRFVSTTTGNTVNTHGAMLPIAHQFVGMGGGWTLAADLNVANNFPFSHTAGHFDDGGFAVISGGVSCTGANVRVLTMSGHWSIAATSGTIWNVTGSNVTVNAAGSTIEWTANANGLRTFAGLSMSYGTFRVSGGGTGGITITGTDLFEALEIGPGTASRTLTLPAGVTTTVSTPPILSGLSTSARLSLVSSSPGTPATLSVPSGTVEGQYLSITDSTATGGATFKAINSLNGGGNSGWVFSLLAVLGLALEDDSAPAPSVQHALTLGQAEESDTALAATTAHALTLGLAQENDTAQPPTPAHLLTLGLASEDDSALSPALQHLRTLGLALETDWARPIDTPGYGPPQVNATSTPTVTSPTRSTVSVSDG